MLEDMEISFFSLHVMLHRQRRHKDARREEFSKHDFSLIADSICIEGEGLSEVLRKR